MYVLIHLHVHENNHSSFVKRLLYGQTGLTNKPLLVVNLTFFPSLLIIVSFEYKYSLIVVSPSQIIF